MAGVAYSLFMSFPADYHMHTPLCHHAVGEPAEYAARAVKLGLPEIGFSEHAPMPRDDFDDWHMLSGDLEEYLARVEKARRDQPSLSIKLALEVDYLPGHEDWIRELAARHPWDYLIGAVHYVSDSWDLDNPKKISEWKNHDPFEVWSAYFERLTMATESGLFEIIAHADLCKKFCFYPERDCTPLFTRFLKAARQKGVALDLNTAGLRKDCKELYRRPLVVTDPGLLSTEAFQRLDQTLGSKEQGKSWFLYYGVHPNPVERDVIQAAEAFRAAQCDGVISIGGGSPLDVGKAARLLVR